MAFRDKITSLFAPRRTASPTTGVPPASEPAPADAAPAAPEPDLAQTAAVEPLDRERRDLIAGFHEGVEQVGALLTRLDRHLDASAKVLDTLRETQQALPDLLRRQHDLAGTVGAAAQGAAKANEALVRHLLERDEARAAIIKQLQALTEGLDDQRRADRDRLDLVLHLQRSSRRVVTFMLVAIFTLFVIVLALLLALALELGPFRLRKQAHQAAAAAVPVAAPEAQAPIAVPAPAPAVAPAPAPAESPAADPAAPTP